MAAILILRADIASVIQIAAHVILIIHCFFSTTAICFSLFVFGSTNVLGVLCEGIIE